MSEFAGTVLITGGSRGIGLGIARRFAADGAKVMLVARDPDTLSEAVAGIVAAGAPADAVASFAARIDDPKAAADAVDAAIDRFGTIDVLVNNAATNPHFGPLLQLDAAAAHKTIGVNLFGPLLWTQLAVDRSMARHGGVILNIASNGAYLVDRNLGWYNVSKAGLIQLTRHLAMELAPGVRVNALAPGLIKTDMSRALWQHDDGAALSAGTPLQRLGEVADVAAAARYLCSPDAAWVTGQTLAVDGGFLVRPVA